MPKLPLSAIALAVKVSVSKVVNNGVARYQVSWFEVGKRKRRFFRTKMEADTEAGTIRDQRAEAGDAWMRLEARERWRLIEAHHKAQERGLDLNRLVDAPAPSDAPERIILTLGPAISELTARLLADGNSERYVSNIEAVLEDFARQMGNVRISAIGVGDLERWLDSKELASRSTYRTRLSRLFRFARRRGYIRENPCERLEPSRYRKPPPRIFSQDELQKLITHFEANPAGLAWFVLATFAGLRPEEARQMKWTDALRRDGAIYVPAEISKNRRDRLVHPIGQTVAWLRYAKRRKARLPFSRESHRRLLKRLRSVIGVDAWPKDVTRHTCASHWLSMTQSAGVVAEQLGNSEAVLRRDYKKPVPKAEAQAFWALKPRR